LLVNPEVKCVVPHHPEHEPVAEYTRLGEHAPHCDPTEWRELIAQEFGKTITGHHALSSIFPFRSAAFDAAPRRLDRTHDVR
jgi:hypothetical protein